MAIKEIITIPNSILKKISSSVEVVDDKIRSTLGDMLETMYAAPGIGLAAIQIGIPKRMIVIDVSKERNEPHCFINPEIMKPSKTIASFEEGCLSVPGVWEEIERPDKCSVKYLNRDGKECEKKYSGLMATVIQHEVDHLEGIVFVDHLSRLKKDRSIKKSIKFQKNPVKEDRLAKYHNDKKSK